MNIHAAYRGYVHPQSHAIIIAMLAILCLLIVAGGRVGAQTAQQMYGSIKGRVIDSAGNPVVGATVRVKGGVMGTKVKGDGMFYIANVPSGGYTLEITSVGLAPWNGNVLTGEVSTTMVMRGLVGGCIDIAPLWEDPATAESVVSPDSVISSRPELH